MTDEGAFLICVMARGGRLPLSGGDGRRPEGVGIIGPYMERGTNPTESKRQGIREARGEKMGSVNLYRCERQRAEDGTAPSSCPRRTNLGYGLNVRPGSGSADPGIFGYFPSLESTSPGGEISPVLLPSAPSSVSLRSTASPLWGEAYKTHPQSLPHSGGKVARRAG